MTDEKKPLIGFIGQGFIGKNYADDFERRGYSVVRYSLEEVHRANKEKIKECDIVFIAVPTPTTPEGFSYAPVEEVLSLVGIGKTAVIKSTIIPGTTAYLQNKYKDIHLLYSPEFLSEATAATDAANPFSNIVSFAEDTLVKRQKAEEVLSVLPKAPYSKICRSTEAEIIKYAHNASGYVQIMLFNAMYDLANSFKMDWSIIEEAIKADPYISNRYAKPLHKSGRGAGGHCFIKDFSALSDLYKNRVGDKEGVAFLESAEAKNIKLLLSSGKDLDLLSAVYGKGVLENK